MTTDEQRIYNILFALVGVIRSRFNQGLNALGIRVASGSATFVSLMILLFLVGHLFLFLNIALGLLLGSLAGGSPALGFVYLSGIYVLLILLYGFAFRARVERSVRHSVARDVHHITDNVNAHLDRIEPLAVIETYRETYISCEPNPYGALEKRRAEAELKVELASADVQAGIQYIRTNYADMARRKIGAHVAHRYPSIRWALPLVGVVMAGSKKETEPSRARTSTPKSRLGRVWAATHAYLPYARLAFNVLRPVLTAMVMSQAQRRLLGLFTRNSRR